MLTRSTTWLRVLLLVLALTLPFVFRAMGDALDNDPGLSNGLVAHWSLDETSGVRADSLGNYPFTPNGTVPSAQGKFGKAVSSTAGNSLTCNLNYGVIPHSFTICFWYKRTELGTNSQAVLCQWQAGGWAGIGMNFAPPSFSYLAGQGRLIFALGHESYDCVFSNPILDTDWHFVVMQWVEGSKLRLGVDNIFTEKLASDLPENPPICTNQYVGLSIGKADFDTDLKHFQMDELCVWNRALSDSEITRLYNRGAGFDPIFGVVQPGKTLWKQMKGDYSGVFAYPQLGNQGTCGYVKLTSNGSRDFTGKLAFVGDVAVFKGRFDSQGNTTLSLHTRSTGVITLALNYTNSAGVAQLSGTASGWSFNTCPVVLTRAESVAKHQILPQAGLYTFAVASGVDSGLPATVGLGNMTVLGNGKTKLFAYLFDGTMLTGTGRITEEETWPIYSSLYSNHGAFGGIISFDGSSSCTGTVYWSKPATRSTLYNAVISASLTLTGTKQ